MRLITKADRRARALLQQLDHERRFDRVPRICPIPTPERVQLDVELIDSVIFSEEIL